MKNKARNDNYLAHFDMAGFTYYEGVEVFEKLKVGTKLKLVPEPENPYDAKAVALYFDTKKLGFIPRGENRVVSKFLNLGYHNVFEAFINRVSPDEHTEAQIGVVVKIMEMKK